MSIFRRGAPEPPVPRKAGVLANEEDIHDAYRLVLRREPDPSGLSHYLERSRDGGLTLQDLVQELLASSEFLESTPKVRAGDPDARTTSDEPGEQRGWIDPRDVIARYSVEELNATAESYYSRVDDPTPLMVKPFAFFHETPEMLQNLGLLLAGLRLGKTMRVLDFGAGTCWLARYLAQLNCEPICCDTSPTALEIGRRLFAESPLLGTAVYQPRFLLFDGYHLDLEDESVDRIVCFDAFHHVPNQAEVLAEFARVLVPGGLIGFSEPGRRHSRSSQAQYEMRNHRVLENDIVLEDIATVASTHGLGDMRVRLMSDVEVPLDAYLEIVNRGPATTLKRDLWRSTAQTITSRSIFFLSKGASRPDSRTHEGLAHELSLSTTTFELGASDVVVNCPITVRNAGTARWLHTNSQIFGIVRIGSHLYDETGRLLNVDHSRHDIPRDVEPGETLSLTVAVPVPAGQGCRLVLDLVSEGVSWFENLGSQPLHVEVRRIQ